MIKAQSIPELTNYEYNELSYNTASAPIKGSFVKTICGLINKCGITVPETDTFDDKLEKAVKAFQKKVNITPTGILTTAVLQSMIVYADKMNDTVTDDSSDDKTTYGSLSESPHYGSFFDDDRYKMHRRNHKDIVIQFGNKSITKTIKDVFMRSVSVDVDTSGNPISETYEFIARDIKESDEISDVNKYNGAENSHTSSDIKYLFKFNEG